MTGLVLVDGSWIGAGDAEAAGKSMADELDGDGFGTSHFPQPELADEVAALIADFAVPETPIPTPARGSRST